MTQHAIETRTAASIERLQIHVTLLRLLSYMFHHGINNTCSPHNAPPQPLHRSSLRSQFSTAVADQHLSVKHGTATCLLGTSDRCTGCGTAVSRRQDRPGSATLQSKTNGVMDALTQQMVGVRLVESEAGVGRLSEIEAKTAFTQATVALMKKLEPGSSAAAAMAMDGALQLHALPVSAC